MKQLEKLINLCLDKNLNFSVFSLPSNSSFEIIIEHPEFDTDTKVGFIFHPFEVSEKYPEIFIPANYRISSESISNDFLNTLSEFKSIKKSNVLDNIVEINQSDYISELEKAITGLHIKKLNKFILSRIKTVENTRDLDLSKYLIRLNNTHSSAFVYLVNHVDSGIWIGASPETLINWNKNELSTMSLAGTLPIQESLPNWSVKEIEEQAYVTKYIQEVFTQHQIDCSIDDAKTIKAGSVYHLHTKITSKNKVSFDQAYQFTKSLHPTPAICGVPVKEAKKMITCLEKHHRAYYTGYLGLVEPGKKLQLFVNLRCMQVLPNSLALYLGGGITAKSIAQKEWNETNHKSQTLLSCLS